MKLALHLRPITRQLLCSDPLGQPHSGIEGSFRTVPKTILERGREAVDFDCASSVVVSAVQNHIISDHVGEGAISSGRRSSS